MINKYDGGPAFPRNMQLENDGMSLRDYFAGQVIVAAVGGMSGTIKEGFCTDADAARPLAGAAKFAYQVADAMLKERDRG